ncbi:SH3 domain-containing protein [Clostridium sp. BSD9I1]|uniref:SH3 domain-containing protein n=1 Tax=Clostridium sp. BSD9I1 TaxID=2003589 RepID=UPI0016462325|nr:SH3 domain-containing protein [Clostridium sp. BSD9I1]
MKYKVIEEHKPNNSNPIKAEKGETVKLGRKSGGDDGWNNWIYCYSLHSNSEGWTPAQIIQTQNEYGIVLNDYSAKELDVSKGDIVDGELELNGWLWCSRLTDLEDGWLPTEKLIAL